MAADQQKKRVNAASLVGCSSREQYRVKRRKLQGKQHELNMRPTISLEWDNKKRSVVSKKEQIGIARRHLLPFIEPGPQSHSVLGDVFSVPMEIFELENLSKVLSYEVWQSYLSDSERSFLSQFLPKEPKPDATVRDLLDGDNFHFGNPFVKWGASICFEELHPDNILREELSLKAAKKAYHSNLQKYHTDMIENLHMWKEKWASCKNAEMEIVQNIWSSSKHAESSIPPSETGYCCTEENLAATPESCSWANSDIACSSDNQNSGMVHGHSQRRKEFLKKVVDNSSSGLNVVAAVSRRGEKLRKRNIQHSDGAKYMSYIKVSREQHERVKNSMKHSGNSIQPRALNNVLGVKDALNIQPFERFEEEERKKLHEHWLKLVTRDIPHGFASWRKRQLLRKELTWSLGEEIGQKMELHETTLDEEKEGPQNKRMELSDYVTEEILPSTTIEGVKKEQSAALLQEQSNNEEAVCEIETEMEGEKEIKTDYIFEEQMHGPTEMIESECVTNQAIVHDHHQQIVSLNDSPRSRLIRPASPGFLQDLHQHQQQISSLGSNLHTNSMEIECHGNDASGTTDEDTQVVSEYPGNLNHVDIPVSQGSRLPCSSAIWTVGDVHDSYYQASATNAGYASAAQGLSIGNQSHFIQEQAVQLLDLDTGRQDKKDILHRQSEDMAFFNCYPPPNQERNEVFHPLFKSQSNVAYQQQQKQLGLEFQGGNNDHNLMMESAAAGQFSGHFREQVLQVHPSLAVDMRQKSSLNDVYESMYGGRFMGTRQDELGVNNVHDWAAVNNNSVRMLVPQMSWYGENGGARDGGWSSSSLNHNHNLSLSSSSRGGGGLHSDQTLFSVLSECNDMLPPPPPTRPNYDERFGNYSGGGIPLSSSSSSNTNFLQQTPNYLNAHEAAAAAAAGINNKMNNLGWMGLSHHNSGLQDSIAKPFLRSWNH